MGMKSQNYNEEKEIRTTRLNTSELLQPCNSVHNLLISNGLNTEMSDLLIKIFRYLHVAPESDEFDSDFTTIVDEPINAQILHHVLRSRSLKSYVIDSLKRYHALADIMETFSSYHNAVECDQNIEAFLDIVEHVTKYVLIVCTIESLSLESQRFLGNLIRQNGIPIPLAYYTCDENTLQFKINFNPLAETLCYSHERILLCIGSPAAIGLGKTSVMSYLFENIRTYLLNTEGIGELRSGCIDTLFASFSNDDSYVVFDVHGTMTTMNEDLVTAIQQHCDVQMIFVTETDLDNKDFLLKTMNYSNETRTKPTMIVVFDSKYGERNNTFSLDQFQQAFSHEGWCHSHWISAPILSQIHANSKSNEEQRLQRLRHTLLESFKRLLQSMNTHTTSGSIFVIQACFLAIKSASIFPPTLYTFEIEEQLKALFNSLSDTTDNLKIVTPISYLESEKLRCKKESSGDSYNRQKEIEKQYLSINRIPAYTRFFIELLTQHPCIDLLIMERFLEGWRAQYEPSLHNRLKGAEENAAIFKNKMEDAIKSNLKEIQVLKEEYKLHQKCIAKLKNQLSNVCLTIGLFSDEIFALYEYLPKLFESANLTEQLARKFAELMCKGFSFHVLRGRPLRCSSKLIQLSLQYVNSSTNKAPLVLTIIGEQSSAKSSLMNATFGCNCRVTAGRCTLGMYLSVVRWRHQTIVILNIEGLLSLEESGSIFDNQMVSLAMLSSHLILINHKGEFSSNLEHLIRMSFYAKLQIRSHLKPKLLFMLHGQVDTTAPEIFCRQLLKLKESLYNGSQFLKSSIEDEIEINDEDVILLPDPFSGDYNTILQIEQTWQNRSYPLKINVLREVIFKRLIDANTQFYRDVPQFFQRVTSNWDSIDKLGPNLSSCKTLYEFSSMNELRDLARETIDDCITAINKEGRQNIDTVLSTITPENCNNLDLDYLGDQFQKMMQITHDQIIQKAFTDYQSLTERSCFPVEIKQKVQKLIEPPVFNMQGLLREEFDDRLYRTRCKLRISNAHRHLIGLVQEELDRNRNLNPQELHVRVDRLYALELEMCLQIFRREFATKAQIISRVLRLYNADLQAKGTTRARESICNLLRRMNTQDFQHACEKLKNLHERVMQQNEYHQQSTTSWIDRVKTFLGFDGSNRHLELLWNEFYQSVESWFCDTHHEKTNKRLLLKIIERLLPQLRNDITNLVNTQFSPFSANSRMIAHLFTFIDNLYHDQVIVQHKKSIKLSDLLFDIAVIAIKILVDEIFKVEQIHQNEELEEIQLSMKTWQESITTQINNKHDASEQGKYMAKNVGEKAFKVMQYVLLDKILHDVTEHIAKNQLLNHHTVQKQAYEESFEQGNGEKILKYVVDINRFFCELSLREISTHLEAIIYVHTRDAERMIKKLLNAVNNIVQQSKQENIRSITDEIEKSIIESHVLETRFRLDEILSIPIQNLSNFKYGFTTIQNYIDNIQDHVANVIRSVKANAYAECKRRISRRLGCQSRCPGCGSKCNLPEPHEEELVEQWYECQCEPGKCNCDRPQPILHGVHRTSLHIAGAFYGRKYHRKHTPVLKLCYQHWMTNGMRLASDELVFPLKKYYNQFHPKWYNNLQHMSIMGPANDEDHPPPEQRRAWMIVRHVLVSRYTEFGMVDQSRYDTNLYPSNIEALPANFVIKWGNIDRDEHHISL